MGDLIVQELIQTSQPLAKVTNIDGATSIDFSKLDLKSVLLDSYYKFENIAYLHLCDNKLEELDSDIFEKCPLLMWLDVRNNKLTSIPKTIQNHANLKTILLSDNRIVKLPVELGSLPMLTGLEVRGNPLEYPSQEVIKKGLRNLICFLRSEWKSLQPGEKQTETPVDEHEIRREGSQYSKSKTQSSHRSSSPTSIGNDFKLGCKTLNLSLVEHMWKTKLIELLESQEKELQKRKDKEEIRKWREKYIKQCFLSNRKNSVLLQPPFGVFDEFQKILSRKDIYKPLMEKEPRINTLKETDDTGEELQRLSQILQSLVEHNEKSLEPSSQMSVSLHEINTLNELLKTLSFLSVKN